VPHGSICGFLGPNGAGKSTTIKLLLGLVKPSSGDGTILGRSIVKDSVAIRERVGFLAQDPSFYGYLSARETLRFVASFFFKGRKAAIENRINEIIYLVGLDFPAHAWIAIGSTLLLTILCLLVASWQMKRYEM
jgi:ABC-2 type transport system ATP-binding protein